MWLSVEGYSRHDISYRSTVRVHYNYFYYMLRSTCSKVISAERKIIEVAYMINTFRKKNMYMTVKEHATRNK